jgi:hypothetical protein
MRKFILVVVLAALGVTLLASPAFAFDHHFSVLAKQKSAQRTHNSVRFKDKLLDPKNRHDRVGRDHGKCRFIPRSEHVKCRAVIHLNGEIGGVGDIRIKGDFERHDNRVNVVGGSGQFNGVAGKAKIHSVGRGIDKIHFDLTR